MSVSHVHRPGDVVLVAPDEGLPYRATVAELASNGVWVRPVDSPGTRRRVAWWRIARCWR